MNSLVAGTKYRGQFEERMKVIIEELQSTPNIVLFTETELKNKVGEIAYSLNKTKHEQAPVFICVLNGAFMFFTDLVKHINECKIDFIQAKSYTGTTQGEIKLLKDITTDIKGKNVYLIDDIFDSGNTIRFLTKHLAFKEPKSITTKSN